MSGKQSTGASEHLPSVTIPNVPSAPTNSLVKSNPAADLRDLRLVLITSPEGKTTVYEVMGRACVSGTETQGSLVISTFNRPHSGTIRLSLFHIERRWLRNR